MKVVRTALTLLLVWLDKRNHKRDTEGVSIVRHRRRDRRGLSRKRDNSEG